MKKKVVVIGGGTGMSTLLKGLKQFPMDISAIVTVCDDGKSSGILRKEFNTPAVGDVRRVLVSLSENESALEKIFNYRFQTVGDLNGHTVGNLLLTAMTNMTGSISGAIATLNSILDLKGNVIPLTENSDVKLVAEMKDGSIVEGEHNITQSNNVIKRVYYEEDPKVSKEALTKIEEADLIILSMGSLYTSIIPNLICKDIVKSIDKSKARILYVCNMMTQPGETDNFKASDHVKELNKYLGKKKVSIIMVNNLAIDPELALKYQTLEEKLPVEVDLENLKKLEIIEDDFFLIEDNTIRHNAIKLGFHIFSLLL